MSDSGSISQETKATEKNITGVAEIGGETIRFPLPPDPIHGPNAPSPTAENPESIPSDEDELQNAWLVSLDARLKYIEANASAAVKHAEAAGKQADAAGKETDNSLRKEMADKTFSFMEKWCAFVALIIFIYIAKHDGDPPKEVILALLGTCTVSIIGLVGFVVSGLFKTSKEDKS